jgi:hypothetical protein
MKLNALLLCLVALGTGVDTIAAQQPGTERPRRVPATVVLVDSLTQSSAPFLLVRRADATPTDLILVNSGIDPAQLSDAIRGLLTARQSGGDFPRVAATLRVRSRQPTGAGARPPFPWAARVLNDLRRADPREVQGVGRARAVEIWLPHQGNGQARPRN